MTNTSPKPIEIAHITEADLTAIAHLLRKETGIKLLPAQTFMLQSRLGRRLRHLGLRRFHDYVALVQTPQGEAELKAMISALTTNVTHFFRENHHFDFFCKMVLPGLLDRARKGEPIRIWSAGCSSGPEPFSLAMCLADTARDLDRLDVKILATDIDPEMLMRARVGCYDAEMIDAVPSEFKSRFFAETKNGFEVSEQLRRLVFFKELNLNADWPMKRSFDVIFCRNVAIYFDIPAQLRLWERLEKALSPDGWLFLGHSERIPMTSTTCLKSAGVTIYRAPCAQPSPARRH